MIYPYNKNMIYNYTGIILGKYNIGEADRIYIIYTLESGKIRVVAKGVRKPRAKLAGHLENFTLSNISVAKTRGIGKITGAVAENNFSRLKNNFESLAETFKAAGILNKLAKEEEKDERVFSLFLKYLEAMNSEKIISGVFAAPSLLTQGFIFKLFDYLGYKIEANVCVKCGKPLSQEGNYFNAERGGILCQNCALNFRNSLKANADSVKIIRIFYQNNIKSLIKLKVNSPAINNLKIISHDFFRWIA